MTAVLGHPRRHYAETDSTNERARALAMAGAPHGTLVTAGTQREGRGRQGRTWSAPRGGALLLSLVVHRRDPLLPLRAGVAVADAVGPDARVKWPNDVLVDGRKVAGILIEARPQEGWAILGIGINVAVELGQLPVELRDRAGTLGRRPEDLDDVLAAVLAALERRLDESPSAVLAALRARDALAGRQIGWGGGHGVALGITAGGGLRVRSGAGREQLLEAGEVHLLPPPG
jgi:BirA family biotin operon repressor/biotin-[acetyl-CoA-carboxylase] ligase